MNLHPKIVLFHDVLSEGEISYIRNQGSENVIYDHNLSAFKRVFVVHNKRSVLKYDCLTNIVRNQL